MQALILAAGRGSRLGSKSNDLPKCLLEVGRQHLIEHQLETLSEAGVGPIRVVVGYGADEIREVVGIRAEYIQNPRWSVTNSLYSFWLARNWIKGPVMILNSDILYDPNIIEKLLKTEGDAVAYDSTSGHGMEHMKVQVQQGRLVSMSKELSQGEVSGENLGILKLTGESLKILFGHAEKIINEGGEKNWLGSGFCELARERHVEAVDVAGLPWGEADFAFDLDRMRKEVWPAIQRYRSSSSSSWSKPTFKWSLAACGLILIYFLMAFANNPNGKILALENVEIVGGTNVRITAENRSQEWWLIREGETATLSVTGPLELEIDSRLVQLQKTPEAAPYVIEVTLDGNRLGWFNKETSLSRTWNHPEYSICKIRDTFISIPEGTHEVGIRIVASDSGQCLVRAQIEAIGDED